MKKTFLLVFLSICTSLASFAAGDSIRVMEVRMAGPFSLKQPVIIDSISAAQEKYSEDKLFDTPLSLNAADKMQARNLGSLNLRKGTLNLASFSLKASSHVKARIEIDGAGKNKIYCDGSAAEDVISLAPGEHKLAVKFIADSTSVGICIRNAEKGNQEKTAFPLTICGESEYVPFGMEQNLGTRVTRSAEISPSGKWALVNYSWYDDKNEVQYRTELCNLTAGKNVFVDKADGWMPLSDKYYFKEKIGGKTQLVTVDPVSGTRDILVESLPETMFEIAPSENFLLLYSENKGPKKEEGVYEILTMDDRQPDWRKRYAISIYDIKSGFCQPLTYGYKSCYVSDISKDGKFLLLNVRTDSLLHRPTSRSTILRVDIQTLAVDTIIKEDGFIGSIIFAKDNDTFVVKATPEAFGGIGNRVPESMIPSMFDYHLYLLNATSKTVKPLTADDKTCIESVKYSPTDDMLYYTAERGDSVLLYRMDLKNGKSALIPQPLEALCGFDIARKSGNIIVHGSSADVPYCAYAIQEKGTKKPSMICNPNKDFYANVKLGTVKPWKFRSVRGYDVTGFYFLPADFDESKKYPVIVHYYGGCSPTSRRFGNGSHYPAHYWNSLGYIVFIVNPSGATGFGQEWAARHVNTMGEGPAQDIIDATRQFVKDVPQADACHIGCVSASYGGFMTQYMLTMDNPFACGISHAGISDHTSYWGEGYWGYSYSEVSAADSYPWTRKDLFVDRSPLYNADKIKKPLLFTHGTADTNVPIGESIQMYTALRLLGTPTAFIQVEGENHGIMNPEKRKKWINSMVAWFDRWLKNDSAWWNAIYTLKSL
ncbi:MAG: prolyl oligopeptidase family serine peptidase [Bacteroidales bacterium]|nr:prolyl oligopeptidase family serine peptidase [Bacteroidales bacterium]MCM1148040.1 prolyl oligopeptidase family serine peptidase [Bacteroidales bacterium]MCM1206857.1 prolyl oligopeptidase family serine peptidase [Bacillota bacterium]MCM1511002.1 prolyl oligopeptidase family serine peptidase [Clostridium sp.]